MMSWGKRGQKGQQLGTRRRIGGDKPLQGLCVTVRPSLGAELGVLQEMSS